MDQIEKYLNFIRNYNQALKEKKTDWLNPDDMGDVLVKTATQNHSNNHSTKNKERGKNHV